VGVCGSPESWIKAYIKSVLYARTARGSRYDYDVRSQNYEDTNTIVENNFRVLLTRARKEMILLIPRDAIMDETYQYFVNMGMDEL